MEKEDTRALLRLMHVQLQEAASERAALRCQINAQRVELDRKRKEEMHVAAESQQFPQDSPVSSEDLMEILRPATKASQPKKAKVADRAAQKPPAESRVETAPQGLGQPLNSVRKDMGVLKPVQRAGS